MRRRSPARVWAVLVLLLATGPATSQEVVEGLLDEELPEDVDVSALLEFLEHRRDQPLDLNRAKVADLTQFPWISPEVARRIVNRRRIDGPYIRVDQLLEIAGVTPDLLERLRPYLSVRAPAQQPQRDPRSLWAPVQVSLRMRASRRWDSAEENDAGGSAAIPYRTYQRAQVTAGRALEATALWEKDPGESRLDDFSSAFLRYSPAERLAVTVGSYQVEAAQGLVLWGPYRFGKGGDPVLPVNQVGRGLRGYRAVDESSALSGAAVSVSLPRLEMLAFWSDRRLDASLVSSGAVRSLDRSGYHRSPGEQARRRTQRERLWGGRLNLRVRQGLRIGATGYRARYDRPFSRTDRERDYYAFQGNVNHVVGIDAVAESQRLMLSAEWARSRHGGWGALASVSTGFDEVTVVGLWRHFEPDFHSLRGRAFSESGPAPRNEQGLYLGLKLRSRVIGELGFSFDHFSSPWRTFTLPFPRRGDELLLQWRRRVRRLVLQLRYRHRQLQRTVPIQTLVGASRTVLADQVRRTWRLQLEYRAGTMLALRTRIEIGTVAEGLAQDLFPAEHGTLLYQQVRWRPRPGWRIEARWTSFDSRSFNSRLYALENDLPGVWSSRAFSGRGTRWYLLAIARMGPIHLGVKLAETVRLQAVQRRREEPGTRLTRELGMYLEWVL